MPEEDIKQPGFNLRRVLLDLSPPKAAHGFGWSRVGDQFLLEVGHFDLKAMSDMIVARSKDGGEGPIGDLDLFVTDRFIMDFASVSRLLELIKTLQREHDRILKELETHANADAQ